MLDTESEADAKRSAAVERATAEAKARWDADRTAAEVYYPYLFGGSRKQKPRIARKQADKVVQQQCRQLLLLAQQASQTVARFRGPEHAMKREVDDLVRALEAELS